MDSRKLRDKLRCKEIWVQGANRYRNPDEDLPTDFEQKREAYCQALNQPLGEGTTACASDSKKFGSWDQKLMTEWHIRYGGRGVMIYWHVEKKSTCIYSQLKSCSSSEVAAMIEGLLRHCTDMKVEKNYVDSHTP
jgi:TnpA family transposase